MKFTTEKVEIAAELISVELRIRLNYTLSCTELYKYMLDSEELLKAIKSNETYTFKKMFNNYSFVSIK